MAKDIYIDGTLLIAHPDFKFQTGTEALCSIPEGAEVWELNDLDRGLFVIDENHPVSIFNTYHATKGVTSLSLGSYYLNSHFIKAFQTYKQQYREIKNNLEEVKLMNNKTVQNSLFKLIYLHMITILDAFICETLISKITSSEDCFDKFCKWYINELPQKASCRLLELDKGHFEQQIIKDIMKTSFADWSKIKCYFYHVYGIGNMHKLCDVSKMKNYFKMRHRIVHRNAREKTGEFHVFTEKEVKTIMNDINTFVLNIFKKLLISLLKTT